MEGLVNYSSEDEQDEPGQQKVADRGGSASSDGSSASPGRSNGKSALVGGSGSGRSSGATLDGGGGRTSTARNSNSNGGSYRAEEEPQRHKAPTPSSGGRSGSLAYYGRDSRDVRETKYSKDNRYDHKANERSRPKDYKSDHKRERDGYHDGRRMPREDERNHYSSSSSFHRFSGGGGSSARGERSRYSSGSNDTFSSSSSSGTHRHYAPHQYQPHHQYRAHDDRAEHRSASEYYGRAERTSGGRHRRRSDSRSPSPAQHHYSKRTPRPDKPRHHSRHRGRDSHSRSRSPVSHSPSRERVGGGPPSQQQPLEQARLSALEMERKIQHADAAEYHGPGDYKAPQPHETCTPSASSARANEALLALPLSDSAPKQPNVIAVATAGCATNNGELAVIQLPSYYNPSVINPNKYAEQVQKRKLLWGAKKAEDTAAKWGNAQFSQDSDGKVASKFMRLMGIKGAPQPKSDAAEGAKPVAVAAAPDVKSREVMFSNMEQQYEVARQTTHTMRGVGLGFSSQPRPF